MRHNKVFPSGQSETGREREKEREMLSDGIKAEMNYSARAQELQDSPAASVGSGDGLTHRVLGGTGEGKGASGSGEQADIPLWAH